MSERIPTCGFNAAGVKCGCGEGLIDPADRYKCVDCDVVFHKHCARKHFGLSGDRVELLRRRVLDSIDGARARLRSDRRVEDQDYVDALIDLIERAALTGGHF